MLSLFGGGSGGGGGDVGEFEMPIFAAMALVVLAVCGAALAVGTALYRSRRSYASLELDRPPIGYDEMHKLSGGA